MWQVDAVREVDHAAAGPSAIATSCSEVQLRVGRHLLGSSQFFLPPEVWVYESEVKALGCWSGTLLNLG